MDPTTAPKLDARSPDEVIAQTEALATAYTTGLDSGPWRPRDGALDFGGVLIRLFGGMVDHLIAQLNQVPDKHRRAFAGLLGLARIAPQPARAPVMFVLAPGDSVGQVPAGAQIAAAGTEQPVVFETELALALTRAQLAAVFVRDVADAGGYADQTAIATGQRAGAFAALGGGQPIDHALYVAVDGLLAVPGAQTVKIVLDGGDQALPDTPVKWSAYGALGWVEVKPVTTVNHQWTVEPQASAIGPVTVNGVTARWLRALVPSQPQDLAITTALHFEVPPSAAVPLDGAYANGQRLDFTRDVLPFGDRPKFNDTCYLASDAAFAIAGTAVTITFAFTPPPGGVNASNDLKLQWESWNGQTATLIGQTTPTGSVSNGFTDATSAFTANGAVSFTLPAAIPRSTIGSLTSRWVRVRIIAGNYGKELTATTNDAGVVHIEQASFRPPSISSVALSWRGDVAAQAPSAIVRQTALTYTPLPATTAAVTVYRAAPELEIPAAPETRSSLQLGFDRAFEPVLTTLYLQVQPPASPDPARFADPPPPRTPPALAWEYWNGAAWAALGVDDGTQGLSRSGLVRFLPPADARPLTQFGRTLYWLRARALDLAFAPMPQLGRVQVNTVWAAHAHTSTGEVLGSSSGARGQRLQVTKTPVLAGQRVEVGEPQPPVPAELAALQDAEGDDVLTPDTAAAVTWVRWHEVADFLASGPRDRHYTFDAATGAVTFGDGLAGMIPPAGAQNVRASYRSGGGTAGNVAAGALAQLKTTVAGVSRVTNLEPAVGGAPIEPDAATLARAARALRHGGRAVAAQDFADLALDASRAIARAVTITPSFLPLAQGQDRGPFLGPDDLHRDGQVIVVIVPAIGQPGQAPSVDLCAAIEDYLRARSAPDAQVTVTGPTWVPTDIALHVAAVSLEHSDAAVAAARAAIAALLDPVTGGDGSGWPFGRRPRGSDLVARVTALAEVDHVSAVTITCPPPFVTDDIQSAPTFDELSLLSRLLFYARSITVVASLPQVMP